MASKSSQVVMVAGAKVVGIPTGEDVSAMDRVNSLLHNSVPEEMSQGWDSKLRCKELTLISASSNPGRTVFSLIITPSHCNGLSNIHGGCTATIFDVCTTCALAPIAKPGFWSFAGTSRTLSVTYLRPISVGEEVLIESEVVHAGKRLCAIKGVMRRKKDGVVLATCEQNKANNDPGVGRL